MLRANQFFNLRLKRFPLAWVLACAFVQVHAQEVLGQSSVSALAFSVAESDIQTYVLHFSTLEARRAPQFQSILSDAIYLGNQSYSVRLTPLQASYIDNAEVALLDVSTRISPQLQTLDQSLENVAIGILLQPQSNKQNFEAAAQKLGVVFNPDLKSSDWLEAEVPAQLIYSLAVLPEVLFIEPLSNYFQPEDNYNQIRQGSINLQQLVSGGLTGAGVRIALGDDGPLLPHIDLEGRYTQPTNAGAALTLHAEQMAGIIAGAGNRFQRYIGAAPRAELYINSEYDGVKNAIPNFLNLGITLTHTSLSEGCNRGYTAQTALADRQLNQFTQLMHVFSAGNQGQSDCEYGAGPGWGNITGGVKTAKNVITVGNISYNNQVVASSSRGPSTDGRIKPDIVAVGEGIMSLGPDNGYNASGGTSAAAASTTGALAQLYEGWGQLFPNTVVDAAVLKAAILNTAQDIGAVGPDYLTGWGRLSAPKAWQTLTDSTFRIFSISDGETKNFNIAVPAGAVSAKIMLYWHDVEASPTSQFALVNDLDLTVVLPNNDVLQPWVLSTLQSPTLLNAPATHGIDRLNNVEQIVLNTLSSATVQVKVNGYDLPMQMQKAVLVWQFGYNTLQITYPPDSAILAANEKLLITWEENAVADSTKVSQSFDGGNTWTTLDIFDIDADAVAIEIESDSLQELKIEITKSGQQHIYSYFFAPRPLSPVIDFVCPDSTDLHWPVAPNAIGYKVYQLENGQMKEMLTTLDTFSRIRNHQLFIQPWVAISAVYPNNLTGPRSNAIQATSTLGCPPKPDISMGGIQNPNHLVVQACFNGTADLTLLVINNGLPVNSEFTVFAQVENQPPVGVTISQPIPTGASIPVLLSNSLPNLSVGNHALKVWVEYALDQAHYNDTLVQTIVVLNSPLVTLPHQSKFDELPNSDIAQNANCSTNATLDPFWHNVPNSLEGDNFDWLVVRANENVNAGFPAWDYNRNNSDGKFLMISNGVNCEAGKGTLLGPCLNILATETPQFIFWAYFSGATGERIHVDVFDGTNWFNNQLVVNGNTLLAKTWHPLSLSLNSFAGQTISLRLRGWTGLPQSSFVLIDDLSFYSQNQAPLADFGIRNPKTCPNTPITLVDRSINTNGSLWSITPNFYTFIQGTNAQSANPVVQFSQPGNYLVKLLANNEFGSDSTTQISAIEVLQGISPPVLANFETNPSITLLPFAVSNPDNTDTWTNEQVPGNFENTTQAMQLPNHSYNAIGQSDYLTSAPVFLPANIPMALQFEYAYAPYNANYPDALQLAISLDCGINFDTVLWEKSGIALATALPRTQLFIPVNWTDWTTIQLPLQQFINKTVVFRLANTNHYGNNLYVDNFLVASANSMLVNTLQTEAAEICSATAIEVTSSVVGNASEYFWQFPGAEIPMVNNQLNTAVTYPVGGNYEYRFVSCNALGCFDVRDSFQVIQAPTADFSPILEGNTTVFFQNNSTWADNWTWTFGDSTTSTEQHPTHIFLASGAYTVQLTSQNACGTASFSTVVVAAETVGTANPKSEIRIFPNPTTGWIQIENVAPETRFYLINAQGQSFNLSVQATTAHPITLDISGFPAGGYVLKAISKASVFATKIMLF